jgi:hypothetical protein
VLYAQLDVAGLDSVLAGYGQSLTTAERKLPSGVASDPAVQALFDGKWVSLDLTSLMTQLSSAGVLHPNQSPGQSRAELSQLLDAFTQTFTKEVGVTSGGTDAQLGTDLLLSTDLHDFAQELLSAVSRAAPGLVTSKDVSRVAKVPHHTLQMHAFVAGGTLTRLSVDLRQLAAQGQVPAGTELPLVLDVSHSPLTIGAPSGAAALDVPTLLQEAMGGSG